jgi:hypothetical protein
MPGADCTGRKATGPQEWFTVAMMSTPNAATGSIIEEAIRRHKTHRSVSGDSNLVTTHLMAHVGIHHARQLRRL